jgi:hypothetical protein
MHQKNLEVNPEEVDADEKDPYIFKNEMKKSCKEGEELEGYRI